MDEIRPSCRLETQTSDPPASHHYPRGPPWPPVCLDSGSGPQCGHGMETRSLAFQGRNKLPVNATMCSGEKDAKKLRSRHAAQSRRVLENTEFDSLASVLPVPRAISNNLLDKASVVRLATSFLKLHRFCSQGQPPWLDARQFGYHYTSRQCSDFDCNLGTRILEALDGFLFCLAEDGTILYVSETVSVGLGLSQIEMIGNRIFDYIHYDDLEPWLPIANRSVPFNEMSSTKIVSRFKSSLVKRATKDTQESSLGYKVVEFTLSARCASDTVDGISLDHNTAHLHSGAVMGYSGYALPLLCSSLPECRMDRNAFVITTLLDFRIHYVDAAAEDVLLASKSSPVRGASVYSFVHTADLHIVENFHREVLKLGSSTSGFFRLMGAKGGCVWTHVSAVRVNRVRARQTQCAIIAMLCCAIGFDGFRDSVLACHQLEYAGEHDCRIWPAAEDCDTGLS